MPRSTPIVDDEMARQRLPGVVVGVVIDGELAYAKGFGLADVATKRKPDADTVFRIGSITKSVTALATLSLRDDGALSLDDPLTAFVPEASAIVYPHARRSAHHAAPPAHAHVGAFAQRQRRSQGHLGEGRLEVARRADAR